MSRKQPQPNPPAKRATVHTYTCADCGGTFDSEWSQEEAHAEAVENWGVRGDAPGMAQVCDDCYNAIMVCEGDEP